MVMIAPLSLDRKFLKTLEEVTLLSRINLAGVAGAEHRSRTRGAGLEFADYRRYAFGDDPRSVDWSAYLRLGKLFLKIYETERHIPVRILLDRSESMDCEGAAESKFLYAQRLAATFAYLALLRLDTAAVIPFASRLHKPLVVSGGRDRLWPVLEFLGEQSCRGGTDLFGAAYPINQNRPAHNGPAMGRYAGDRYYSGGAYYFSTTGAAEFCFRAAVDREDAQDWIKRGDAFLETVHTFTPPSGAMSEQFDQRTGAQASARHLAWSYASFISCVAARRAAIGMAR